MKPRVFVSSVMENYFEFRKAARNGIVAAGGEPVLVEDYSSLCESPRNACLDGVASSEIVLIILGSRGGWTAPSGKLVVEEEYEEARQKKKRVLVFAQDIKRDGEADKLYHRLSDYIDGTFRATFDSPSELEAIIIKALQPLINLLNRPEIKTDMIMEKFEEPYQFNSEASLRFVLSPERDEEFVDQVSIVEEQFKQQLFEIGHSSKVELFSYEKSKVSDLGIDNITILQSKVAGRRNGFEEVRLELTTKGMIIIDIIVSGLKEEKDYDISGGFIILEEDIRSGLKKCFAFVREFYGRRDPYKRYHRMTFDVGLVNIGHRNIVSERPRGSSFTMHTRDDKAIIAYDQPRNISIEEVALPEREINAVISILKRRIKN